MSERKQEEIIKKNTPLEIDTEVNDRIPLHGEAEVASPREPEGLPIKTLLTHIQSPGDDKNALDEDYARHGAEDIDDDEDEDGTNATATYLDISVCCRIKKSLVLRAFGRNPSRAFL